MYPLKSVALPCTSQNIILHKQTKLRNLQVQSTEKKVTCPQPLPEQTGQAVFLSSVETEPISNQQSLGS